MLCDAHLTYALTTTACVGCLEARVLNLERELEAEKARTRRIATRKVFGVTELDLEEAQCTIRDHINQNQKPRIMR